MESFILLLFEIIFVSGNSILSIIRFFVVSFLLLKVWSFIYLTYYIRSSQIYYLVIADLAGYVNSVFIFVSAMFCSIAWSILLGFDPSFIVTLILVWRNFISINKSLAWTVSSYLNNRKNCMLVSCDICVSECIYTL